MRWMSGSTKRQCDRALSLGSRGYKRTDENDRSPVLVCMENSCRGHRTMAVYGPRVRVGVDAARRVSEGPALHVVDDLPPAGQHLRERNMSSQLGVQEGRGMHLEYSIYTLWRCIGRCPRGSGEPPRPPISFFLARHPSFLVASFPTADGCMGD